MNGRVLFLNRNFIGYGLGVLSALLFAVQITINRYVGITFAPSQLSYIGLTGVGQIAFGLAYISFHIKATRVIFKRTKSISNLSVMLGSAFFGSLLTTIGQLYANPTNSAVLSTFSTISTAIISAYVLKTKLNKVQKIAILMVVIGAYIAMIGFAVGTFSLADLFVFCATIFFGFNNVYSKLLMAEYNSMLLASVRICIVGVGLVAISAISSKFLLHAEWAVWAFASGALFWLIIVCLYKSFEFIGPNKAIIVTNLYVVVVLFLSSILFNNSIALHQVIGSIIVLVSIYFAANTKEVM